MASGPSSKLLTPENSTVILIDHQPQMYFGVENESRNEVMNSVAALAETAKAFKVPTVLTSISSTTFAGPLDPNITSVFPNAPIIDRTIMNAWEDQNVVSAVKETGRKKLVMAGLWTEVCLTLPVLSALEEGYEVYIVVDASGGSSKQAHDAAVQRMVQAGAQPVTWMQVLYEYQRDWSRQSTYEAVTNIAQKHGGAHGLGIFYAKSMFHAQEGKKK
ncbi:hydrolase [Pseudomonas baetica]|uniref:hydrolase n=1 Tax=Pseudomonas baetica TaxID=674054 RepID=UPI003EE82613